MGASHLVRVMRALASPRYLSGSKFVGAGAVIFNPSGQLLLIQHRIRRAWEYPAGGSNGNESPEVTCQREVREEIGLSLSHYRLVGVHFRIGWALNGHLFFTFVHQITANQADRLKFDRLEVTDWQWADRDEALTLVQPRMKRRLEAIYCAIDSGNIVYAEESTV